MEKHTNTKALALYLFTKEHEDESFHELKLNSLRLQAKRRELCIERFYALDPLIITKGFQVAINVCIENNLRFIIVDSAISLKIDLKNLIHQFESLMVHRIKLIFADSDLVLHDRHLQTFYQLLLASDCAIKDSHSQKIKTALKEKKQSGHSLGARRFGKMTQERVIISQILKMHSQGLSLKKICDKLAENNIKTVHQKNWHPTTIKRILERYKT